MLVPDDYIAATVTNLFLHLQVYHFDWIEVTKDRIQWWVFVVTVMNIWGS
jgi:hypothetical protein